MSLNDSYDIDAVLREFRMIGRDSEYYPESEESVIPVPKARSVPANENSSDWDKVNQNYLLTCYWAAIQNLSAKPVQPQVPLSFWVCQFCRNNGESSAFYRTHRLKDENHRVCCPVLRNYVCPICGATGDFAHTLKYCPFNTDRPSVPLITRLKGLRNSMGKRRGCGKYYPS